ncbi:MAG TPA: peptidoglycan DD-metalloendopeptidase family protein, partial [Woeseiaceae bacterium]
GLSGYGRLIIIKHNDTYLSAYGHNESLLVREGEMVDQGQRVATMGERQGQQPRLHFEIRRNGKPEDPLKYLPAR